MKNFLLFIFAFVIEFFLELGRTDSTRLVEVFLDIFSGGHHFLSRNSVVVGVGFFELYHSFRKAKVFLPFEITKCVNPF